MDFYYFIVDDVASSNKSDLPTGTRVFRVPEAIAFPPKVHPLIPNLPVSFDTGEGPYESIQQLKENSELFRELVKNDPKRAAKICGERFLIQIDLGGYAMYSGTINDEFHKSIYPLLLHTIGGTFGKNDVSGIHYFDSERVRVRQLVGYDEQTMVWQAYIEAYNVNASKWIFKREPTTFFPRQWTYTRIIAECEYAYLRRVKLSETKFKGITESGVLIVFIYDESGKFKTVYPVCEEL